MSFALPVSGSYEQALFICEIIIITDYHHNYCFNFLIIILMILPILLLLMATLSLHYEIINAFNCGSQTVLHSPLVTYASDQMYQGLTSKSLKKQTVPSKYIDPIDMQLLFTQRTTDGQSFSYFLRLKGPDQYLLLFKFIEVVYQQNEARIFEVHIGDESVLSIDIVKEAGFGQVLHKWIEFDLREEVIFIDGKTPALNGYIYPKQLMKLTFSRIRGNPKVEALILVKGQDRGKFLNEYLEYQNSKNRDTKEYASQEYHKPIKLPYKRMTGGQHFDFPQENLWFYLKKIFSFNTLFSIIAVTFVILHEKIYEKLNLKQDIKND